MPRSIERRLERLEGRTAARPRPEPTTAELVAWLERMVAAGHPATASDAFRSAWAEYTTARGRLAAETVAPPADYRPGDGEAERRCRWAAWDHPDLRDAVGRFLQAFCDGMRRAQARAGHPAAGPPGG